jgi:alpha-tubulin suppressor-like RCC1 family protein/predicted nucleic acid-binding Zn ribbon protein
MFMNNRRNPEMASNSIRIAARLNEEFYRWLNNVPIDDLRRGLNEHDYEMKSNWGSNRERERALRDRIRTLESEESKKREAEKQQREKLELDERIKKEREERNKFREYLNKTEKKILYSHDVFIGFKKKMSSYKDESKKEILKEKYGKNIEYIQSEKFLEDNEDEFGARNLMWLINKQKPDAGRGIIALILSNYTFIDLLDNKIEYDKKQNEISLVKNYLKKLQNSIISSHKMFLDLPEFYNTLPEIYKSEIEKINDKKKEILSINFLKGDQPKIFIEKLCGKSTEIGEEIFELALKRLSYSNEIESNIKSAKNIREENEWTEIKESFDKMIADIENTIKANSPSNDIGFPEKKEIDDKNNEKYLKLKTKINELLTEIEKIVIINSSNMNTDVTTFDENNSVSLDNDNISSTEEEYEKNESEITDEKIVSFHKCISTGFYHTVGLKKDGTVVADGDNEYGQCDTQDWRDIIAISAGNNHTVGLNKDGTVVAVGDNEYGQCDTQDWSEIIAVSASGYFTIGEKKDGSIVFKGIIIGSKREVGAINWSDIIAVSGNINHTVILKKDGTVVGVGNTNWRDIIAVSAGFEHTVGLKNDGTVVAVGENEGGQCKTKRWRDIIAVSAGFEHTVGLKNDGTVVAVGVNEGQCDTQDWRDIIAISAGNYHTVGLKKDGTVVAVGDNDDGQCDTQDWSEIGPVLNDNEPPNETKNIENKVITAGSKSTEEIPDKKESIVIDEKINEVDFKKENETVVLIKDESKDESKDDNQMENNAYRHNESVAQVKVINANEDPRLALDDDDKYSVPVESEASALAAKSKLEEMAMPQAPMPSIPVVAQETVMPQQIITAPEIPADKQNCTICGAIVTEDAAFCSKCGNLVKEKEPIAEFVFCIECGTKLPSDSAFCDNCGAAQ